MRDSSRRAVLRAGLALGTVGLAGCGSRDTTQETTLPELGTDFESDLSGDGIPDPLVERIEEFEEVSPYRKNVLVEVDHAAGADHEEILQFTRSVFADAPVDNPDGSTGIDVHFINDGAVEKRSEFAPVRRELHFGNDRTSVFDRRHKGFRHLAVDSDPDTLVADRSVLAVGSGRSGRAADLLAADLAGRFDPFVGEGVRTAEEALFLPDTREPTAKDLQEAIDWELVVERLPDTVPSLWWYKRKYAHVPDGSDVPEPILTRDDLGGSDTDTSGDGFTDRQLVESDELGEVNPLRKNVFVEVDYQEGIPRELVEKRVREMQSVFADGPVRNPDGSMGIDVNVTIDEEVSIGGPVTRDETGPLRERYFDRKLKGHFYMLFVRDLENIAGVAEGLGNVMLTEPSPSTPLHELGHKLGLFSARPGIDQRNFSFAEYPSAMNYNAPLHALVFSGERRADIAPNDWATMERLLPEQRPLASLL